MREGYEKSRKKIKKPLDKSKKKCYTNTCQGDDRDEVPESEEREEKENFFRRALFYFPLPQQIKILKKPLDKQLNIGYNKTIENNKHFQE